MDSASSADLKRKLGNDTDDENDSGEKKQKGEVKSDKTEASAEANDKPKSKVQWTEFRAESLDCDYCRLYSKNDADRLLRECEEKLIYNTGDLTKVFICGKWQNIPRQQVAFGDAGLSYTFSGHTVPARPWLPFLEQIRDVITKTTGYGFNFVLVNRYKDGSHYIGEHRDDERDLAPGHPIASLSLGQKRDFVFKHAESRGKSARRKIEPVKMELEHGGLLMIKNLTNTYWYHSLPQRKAVKGARISMTFRKMVVKKKT